MPTPQDIASFRYGIKEKLIFAPGYFYLCNDKMNSLLKDAEGLSQDDPVAYCILMYNKGVGVDPANQTSKQRNVYFRYDFQNNIFFMEPTEKHELTGLSVTAFEYNVYFFPQAKFVSIAEDYVALEKWFDGGPLPKTTVRDAGKSLADFLNDNDGIPFALTRTHTPKLRK